MNTLLAVPNVSAPQLPCNPGQTAIPRTTNYGWDCVSGPVVCPAGTTLYVSAPAPFEWRFCTPDITYAVVQYGPNQATAPLGIVAVPTLSEYAVMVLVAALALTGAWRCR